MTALVTPLDGAGPTAGQVLDGFGFPLSCPFDGERVAFVETHATVSARRVTIVRCTVCARETRITVLARVTALPWEPVDELLVARLGVDRHNVRGMARLLEVSESTVHRYRARGVPNGAPADRVAAALGLNPLNIWPDYLDDLLAEIDATASAAVAA